MSARHPPRPAAGHAGRSGTTHFSARWTPGRQQGGKPGSGRARRPTRFDPENLGGRAIEELTHLLQRWRAGEDEALAELTPMVYAKLRALASHHMRFEDQGHLLQTTALVHEAFLRLVGSDVDLRDRNHFFSLSSRIMRRVLVDLARRRGAARRGGGVSELRLAEEVPAAERSEAVLALDAALEEFESLDPRKAKTVELRYFGGLTVKEIASIVDRSTATVERDLRVGKAWLQERLREGTG